MCEAPRPSSCKLRPLLSPSNHHLLLYKSTRSTNLGADQLPFHRLIVSYVVIEICSRAKE